MKTKKALIALHEPFDGEAYPDDPKQYCTICVRQDGGSEIFPCRTLRTIGFALTKSEKQARHNLVMRDRRRK